MSIYNLTCKCYMTLHEISLNPSLIGMILSAKDLIQWDLDL